METILLSSAQFKKYYSGKTILVTGHTGFKGSWLCAWLHELGAKVSGLSIDLVGEPSHFIDSKIDQFLIKDLRVDVLDIEKVVLAINKVKPDIIFHLAAQALVKTAYVDPISTFRTNVLGSISIMDAVRRCESRIDLIMITSDKVYENLEWPWGYRENDKLGGKDPYSASKAMAELAISSYCNSFFIGSKHRLTIARAGNVIGGGDWANDRLVPDCFRAWLGNESVQIRHPGATRPWQHVLEPLSGYLALAQKLGESDACGLEAYNFGPSASQDRSVEDLVKELGGYFEGFSWDFKFVNENKFHEAGLLKLNCDKALRDLSWTPTLVFAETLQLTAEWYVLSKQHEVDSTISMREKTLSQIQFYTDLFDRRNSL